MNDYLLRKATKADKSAVTALYDAVKGSSFCTWNEYYPGEQEVEYDLANDNLYLFIKNGKTVGAVSVVTDHELDDLPFWTVKENASELARLCLSPDVQGQGLSILLLSLMEDELRKCGKSAVHFLAAEKNLPAVATYKKARYSFLEKVSMYGNEYFACEKDLTNPYG